MKNFLVVCSPSAGMLDNWFPVLFELKKKSNKIDIFFPSISILKQVISNKFYLNSLNKIFSNLYYISDGKIKVTKSIKDIKDNQFIKLSNKINNFFIKNFNFEFDTYNFIKSIFKFNKLNINYTKTLKKFDFILCDIVELAKENNLDFAKQFIHIKKISMCHGPDFPYFNEKKIKKNFLKNKLFINSTIILFSNTKKEKNYYYLKLKNKNLNFARSGNPKHDPSWVKKFLIKKRIQKNFNYKNSVFLISRNSDSRYLPAKRKIEYLKILKKILIDKYNLKIIIKLHPKEIYKGYFYKIFKKENFNINWTFSEEHPFTLGFNSLFSVSFFSGVSVDMLKINRVNIEFLNLNSLQNRNGSMIFYKKKRPLFRIAYLNLTLNCQNVDEFQKKICMIINDYKQKNILIKKLNKNYIKIYNNENNAIKQVLKIIKK